MSEPALKAYCLARLMEIFPEDFAPGFLPNVDLTVLSAGSEDPYFEAIDHDVFVAYGREQPTLVSSIPPVIW